MINFFKKIKFTKTNRGMTYVELIVVLSIFAIMSSSVIYSYGEFQAKIDVRNLASDIALKIVEAQRSALSGLRSSHSPSALDWKPAYGVYFSQVSNPNGANDRNFFYFTDRNNNFTYDDSSCSPDLPTTECLDQITILKGDNYISKIEECTDEPCATGSLISSLSVTFKRPDSRANFNGAIITGSEYVQITVVSPKSVDIKAVIKIYPSGRIQVN